MYLWLHGKKPLASSRVKSIHVQGNGSHQSYSSDTLVQLNGVVECKNRTLLKWQDVWLKEKHIPDNFWMEAVMCANYVLDHLSNKSIGNHYTL